MLFRSRTFSDPTSGVSITLVSADANSAVLDVVVPASTPQPPPPSATLTESVGTDATQYARGATVRMSALVKRDGVVASGATVAFSVTQPNGSKTVVNAVSGTDGYARATYKSGKTKSAVGNYGVRADATLSGGSTTATTAFSVY